MLANICREIGSSADPMASRGSFRSSSFHRFARRKQANCAALCVASAPRLHSGGCCGQPSPDECRQFSAPEAKPYFVASGLSKVIATKAQRMDMSSVLIAAKPSGLAPFWTTDPALRDASEQPKSGSQALAASVAETFSEPDGSVGPYLLSPLVKPQRTRRSKL